MIALPGFNVAKKEQYLVDFLRSFEISLRDYTISTESFIKSQKSGYYQYFSTSSDSKEAYVLLYNALVNSDLMKIKERKGDNFTGKHTGYFKGIPEVGGRTLYIKGFQEKDLGKYTINIYYLKNSRSVTTPQEYRVMS